jgi:glycosyltransferase involved in cell wall biosynthesis
MDINNKYPMGGTELMMVELKRRLDTELLETISIFNYLPHADFSKKTIYWNQLSYDQDAVQFLINDKEYLNKIDRFVFVSHWQSEQFRKIFNIPGYKSYVIKNACLGVDSRKNGIREKVKLCYTSTPWRGLGVLLKAWEILKPENCELHIFSSCKIYGSDFAQIDSQYQHLYDKCNTLPDVHYRGSIPNKELRDELHTFDILAYPNTFEETSCISVIDAISAGLKVITSNIGALPETAEGWVSMYPYLMNENMHAYKFAGLLNKEIHNIKAGVFDNTLQLSIYKQRWSWDSRINEWYDLINDLTNEL